MQPSYKVFLGNKAAFIYSRSLNNVNVVYCNYKETNSNYNVISERNSPQSLPNVGNTFKMFV